MMLFAVMVTFIFIDISIIIAAQKKCASWFQIEEMLQDPDQVLALTLTLTRCLIHLTLSSPTLSSLTLSSLTLTLIHDRRSFASLRTLKREN